MTTNDPLAACLSKIDNAERVAKNDVYIEGISSMKRRVLEILKTHGYIDDVEYIENLRGGNATVHLSGHINKCGAIKPRFRAKVDEIEKFEKRYLPAKGFGIIIMSTSKGLITNVEAKEQRIGGRLVAYCY